MSDILVVVVIYNTLVEKLPYINSLEHAAVLVYDNSATPQIVPEGVHYQHNPKNPGVSEAYNYGISLAGQLGKQYCLLLDQDSQFDQTLLDHYLRLIEKHGDEYLYAPLVTKEEKIYSPFIELWNRNTVQQKAGFKYSELYALKKKSLINSGLLIPLKIGARVGGFNNKIKLDFSDTFFMESYKLHYNKIVLVDAEIKHSISGDEGKDAVRELQRFRYYCNGAREMKKSTMDAARISRLMFFRTLRLVVKYRTLQPISLANQYYRGNKTI